jgi:tRNA modification GTPase
LAELEQALIERLSGGEGNASGTADDFAVGLRHAELLDQAAKALAAARRTFGEGRSGEFTMVDLKETLDALGRILGEETGDAVLDRIFNRFCIGK